MPAWPRHYIGRRHDGGQYIAKRNTCINDKLYNVCTVHIGAPWQCVYPYGRGGGEVEANKLRKFLTSSAFNVIM